jgi:hypothetical protein
VLELVQADRLRSAEVGLFAMCAPDHASAEGVDVGSAAAEMSNLSASICADCRQRLLERVSPEQVEAMRSVLVAMTQIKVGAVTTGAGRRRPAGQLRRFFPIFPVRDLGAALVHYSALGFRTFAYEGGEEYGFANCDGVGLHLDASAERDATHPGAAYLYVRDADALYEEWTRPGIAGHTHPVRSTSYKLREGSHADPDGNLIRFGSPVKE